ncbi:phosphoribosyltransferase [Stanieria cyanosphaera PCC 7437]|uniref:Phosphoribosyltransferase n=1 Tax=Stanieria cyanosphaera (strain ATCC 29371 / PCC 7437) TaxID=111780 RepID=K9XNP6_STAC7|nr:phosphoribosyltransferase family protein [Stanieria cyanosphaera]AFZ33661.1 phosphoribosyltransferase [Stanieria cyanosphaera PCC 7437]
MTDLYVSWSEYHQKIEALAVKIYQSGWEFNQIVCLAKGGLRVGDLLCRLYRQPLAILFTSSYTGKDNRTRGKITFSQHLASINSQLGDRILLVDDLVDSGVSLQESIKWLQKNYEPNIVEIRSAVIWYKSCSIATPDYYVDYLQDNPWIHQPFERYEQLSLAELTTIHNKIV